MGIFEDVKNSLNMAQVLAYYGFTPNRQGQCLCPFHGDKNPSMKVYDKSFYCFSCGTGGDLIKFTALYNGVSNIDACKELIQAFDLPIQVDGKKKPLTFREQMKIIKRQQELEAQKQYEAWVDTARDVLSNVHRYLWQSRTLPIDDERHILYLQNIDAVEYYIDCLQHDPQAFYKQGSDTVKHYEREFEKWNNENK